MFQSNTCSLQCELLPIMSQPPLSPSRFEFYTWDAPSAPLHQLTWDQQSQTKNGLLHHGQGDPVGCHRPRLDRDPQVFCVVGRVLLLLCFWPRRCHGVSAAAATAAVGMATAAAVAAHHQSGEEHQQGKSQEDHQADCVVDPLVVFVCGEAPKLVEKILDADCFPVHGFQRRSSFKWVCVAVVKIQ